MEGCLRVPLEVFKDSLIDKAYYEGSYKRYDRGAFKSSYEGCYRPELVGFIV